MKVEPDKHIVHSETIVADILMRYELKLTEYREASAGIENTTLLVDTTTAPYVLRVYRQHKKTNEQIEAELDFMSYLRDGGIPIPRIIKNDQQQNVTLFEADGKQWQAIVMEYVEGEHIETPTPELLKNMATIQAQMHLQAAAYITPNNVTRKLTELVEREFIHQIDLTKVSSDLRAFLERGKAFRLELGSDLPTGPCHMDYDEQNMLCEKDAIRAVLDFDDMSVAPYVICLAYTLWHARDQCGTKAIQDYLNTYQQLRALTAPEKVIIYPAMLFRHYMITAIKILAGETSDDDVQTYLDVERFFMSHKQ